MVPSTEQVGVRNGCSTTEFKLQIAVSSYRFRVAGWRVGADPFWLFKFFQVACWRVVELKNKWGYEKSVAQPVRQTQGMGLGYSSFFKRARADEIG